MQTYSVFVEILPREEILDPQGKATLLGLHNLGFAGVQDVRVGKLIRLQIAAATEADATAQATEAGKKLLANALVEAFTVRIAGVLAQ